MHRYYYNQTEQKKGKKQEKPYNPSTLGRFDDRDNNDDDDDGYCNANDDAHLMAPWSTN